MTTTVVDTQQAFMGVAYVFCLLYLIFTASEEKTAWDYLWEIIVCGVCIFAVAMFFEIAKYISSITFV